MFFIESSPGVGNVFEMVEVGQGEFPWISLADELAVFDPTGAKVEAGGPGRIGGPRSHSERRYMQANGIRISKAENMSAVGRWWRSAPPPLPKYRLRNNLIFLTFGE